MHRGGLVLVVMNESTQPGGTGQVHFAESESAFYFLIHFCTGLFLWLPADDTMGAAQEGLVSYFLQST